LSPRNGPLYRINKLIKHKETPKKRVLTHIESSEALFGIESLNSSVRSIFSNRISLGLFSPI